ncbi:bacteriorhodopsin [Halorubrum lacusprofundi]|jgi:sensory rhodopsin|uniref:Rhodopsin n=1 Tax=Halorubrum lacusprofundi (strain ATCC 49239 / DSM 5036 / JCM 8891 / ACAM 34) TaxID=416348 RepID=B9LQT9_HALLT|nr:bacteriorhodopsin [Halorubrum lacusprofundi]ACM55691.1 rhodopsin [Halorubrum lacusprofundi ATCC 49239]MCG1007160.1 bacteriorhodopsin [Halorubrum lacusprofundi]
MLVDTSVWAWLGVLAMGAGTILPLWAWFSRSSETGESHAVYYLTLAGVTGVAALAYFAMALDVGTVSVSAGDLEVVRYVDWLVTTPLLILYLGLLARPSRRVLVGLIGVDVVIIAGGIVAAATTGTVSWVAFGVAGVAYLGLVYGLLVSLPRSASAEGDRIRAVFGTLRNITVVLWTLYPVVWLLAPTGFGLLTPTTEMLVFVYLDIVSKVGFVVVAVMGADALNRLDDDREFVATDPAVAPDAEEHTTVLGDD